MLCSNCGAENETDSMFCISCGSALNPVLSPVKSVVPLVSPKDKGVLIFCAHFGAFGIDRFYRGQAGLGVLKLLTLGGCGIWALIDLLTYELGGLVTDSEGKVIVDRKTLNLIQSG
jgi:TM2 domain-containing membrane protein YozV